ncbi:MAG: HlyD family type I secretion periplasmic adaptor subunit, partial [Alphaproteobacteria bacterium]|nr:HlyD family type I secretion periplasmic adaptor subunit [Alphaproteobacteria bacterium]
MSKLDDLLVRTRVRRWRLTAWAIVIVVCAIGVWAYFAELERVATAEGAVIPQGQIKTIQHLEGGIINEINVVEGSVVKAGTVLIKLDTGIVGSAKEESQVDLDGLILTRARLEAEAKAVDLKFPKEEAERRPDIVVAERQAFDGNQRSLESTLKVLDDQLRQRQHEVTQLQAELRAAENNYSLARE